MVPENKKENILDNDTCLCHQLYARSVINVTVIIIIIIIIIMMISII